MTLKKLFILVVMALLGMVPSFAAPITVKASLDSVNLQMGRISTLHLSLSQPRNIKGHFPLFSQVRENGIIPVCGDSVELRYPSKIDTVAEGERLNISLDVPLQAFDSGYYQLPAIAFVNGADTVESNRVAFKVYPVAATADTPIGDFASTADPAGWSIFDFLPDWVVDFWWLIIIVLLALTAFWLGFRRYRKEGSILPKKPLPTPYEAAVEALAVLKSRQLWQQGHEKEYYTELTDILRRYLYGRFGINATEMTSRQILARLDKNPETKDKRQYFRQILDMADFVKFAKVRPLPDDNVLAFENAERFVRETKPVDPVLDNDVSGATPGGAVSLRVTKERKEKGGAK